jgi:hypothetical protein
MKLALADGEATLHAIDGDRVSLDASVPAAPGTPLCASLESGTAVRIKVHRCVRAGDRFSIEGRLLDASRALRQEIEGALQRK